jgi:tetratricopeptide (TPR) repeat protein
VAFNTPSPAQQADLLQLFSQAVVSHNAGRIAAAADLYEQILAVVPTHPKVLDLYGTALFQLGAPELGRPYLALSVSKNPREPTAWNHLGVIDQTLNRFAAASSNFQRAAVLDPSQAEPYVNLAKEAAKRGIIDDGLRVNRFALSIAPQSCDAVLRQGVLLQMQGDIAAAIPILTRCWQQQPGNREIALHLGRGLYAAGKAELGRDILRAGIVCSPATVELTASLLNRQLDTEISAQDLAWSIFASILGPGTPQAWVSRSAAHSDRANPKAAISAASRAILLQPNDSRNLHNVIAGLSNSHISGLARQLITWGLIITPDSDDLKLFLSEIEFRTGDLRLAWQLWEHRQAKVLAQVPRLNMPPLWRGQTGPGKLLIMAEQGVGDEIIFLSCLPDLLDQMASPPVVEVDPRLVSMVARSFPDMTIIPRQIVRTPDGNRHFDYQSVISTDAIDAAVFGGSLPLLRSQHTIQPLDRVGYLRPDPEQVAHWQAWLDSLGPKHKIGLTLRTAKISLFRAQIHCQLEDMMPVLQHPDCDFINLMPANDDDDAAMVAAGLTLRRPPGLDPWNDLDGLLALMAALDIVISARTANCAFAAAVGVPTIRLAQGFMYLMDGRDYYFPNCMPMLHRDEVFDGQRVGQRAYQKLLDLLPTAH